MNSTRLRALWMKHLRWLVILTLAVSVMACIAAISYRAQEWLPLAASLAVGSISFLATLDHLRDFLKYLRLYRIQADAENQWTRQSLNQNNQ